MEKKRMFGTMRGLFHRRVFWGNRGRTCRFLGLGLLVFFFSSCIGIRTNITIRENGAGTLELEYRISRIADSLGKLDGNEGWLTLPVGRADFERTVSRIDGLRLASFSSAEDEKDRVVQVKVDFSNPEALSAFLDASGQRSRLTREKEKYRLSLTLGGGGGALEQDPELLELTGEVFLGYALEFGLTLPRDAILILADPTGKEINTPPVGDLLWNGRNIRFSAPMAALLRSKEPVFMEILW
ncbi:MAG: hypothetical protein LBC60_12450 [Spirochaetaceae bacterium]|jgi:hypothetical protein|nr:hypothetical protein [Spirochaetaceae bacterium]